MNGDSVSFREDEEVLEITVGGWLYHSAANVLPASELCAWDWLKCKIWVTHILPQLEKKNNLSPGMLNSDRDCLSHIDISPRLCTSEISGLQIQHPQKVFDTQGDLKIGRQT